MKLHLRGRVLNPIFTQDCDKTDWKATSVDFLLLVEKMTVEKNNIEKEISNNALSAYKIIYLQVLFQTPE